MGVAGPRRPTSAPCQRRWGPGPADATRTPGDQRGPAGRTGPTAAAGAGRGWGVGGAGEKTETWKRGSGSLRQGRLGESEGTGEVGPDGGEEGPGLWKGRGRGGGAGGCPRDAAFYERGYGSLRGEGNPREGGEGAGRVGIWG